MGPKRVLVANLHKNWNDLRPKIRNKICSILHEAGWKEGVDNWSQIYDKLSGAQRIKVIKVLKHEGIWDADIEKLVRKEAND